MAIVAGGVICLIVSYLTSEQAFQYFLLLYCADVFQNTQHLSLVHETQVCSPQGIEKNREWDKTRDIDNPLTPWTMLYQVDLNMPPPKSHHERPPVETSVFSPVEYF